MDDADDIINPFLAGLDDKTHTVVARSRAAHRNYNYLDVVQYARAEGDAVMTRHGSMSKKLDGMTPEWIMNIGMLQYSSESEAQAWYPNGPKYESLHYLGETKVQNPLSSTTDVP